MNDRKMSRSRGPKETFSDDEVIIAIREIGDPAVKPGEIAERLDVTSETVRNRLARLKEDGLVESKQFGSGSGWWISQTASSSRS